MSQVKLVILLSGKRKCGKDFISEKLNKRLGEERCQIIRISEPIKSEWARQLNLSLKELLSDGPYKEKYRKDMIEWSDEVRAKDYGFFCREAISNVDKEIVIVSDIRRKNDIKFFKETFQDKIKTVRISCSEEERIKRGWGFQKGIDDVDSECNLDDYEDWDVEILNENRDGEAIVKEIMETFALS